jgi:two-component system, OmpR family, response regulator
MSESDRVSVFSADNRANVPVYPADVFFITKKGSAQIEQGGTELPAEALTLLVALDGEIAVGDLEEKLPHIPSEAVRDMLRSLLAAKLIRPATVEETTGFDFETFLKAMEAEATLTPGAMASARREAGDGAPMLQKRGYYVSIARKAVKARELKAGEKLEIFAVEDDPDMSALIQKVLEEQGFKVTVAANRAEVVDRLRVPPMPDLALLDVNLPDTNGFDILQNLKAHPALRTMPAIMVTAEAKRESVMRGLVGGADGYITKPFERAALVDGVKAVLGIAA